MILLIKMIEIIHVTSYSKLDRLFVSWVVFW